MNDKMKYKGFLVITDSKGKHRFNNIVVDGFYQLVADRMIGSSENYITHFGFGTGTNVASSNDTALQTETGDRKAVVFSESTGGIIHLQTAINGNELLYTWREVGIFTASTDGIMTNRVNLTYTHNAGESVTLDYYIQKEE